VPDPPVRDPWGVSSVLIAVVVGLLAAAGGWFAWRHRRPERPYAAVLRALARADNSEPLVPVVTMTASRQRARAEQLHRVRTASTAVLCVLAVALLLVPGHRLWTAALGAALILRMVYELLVEVRVTRRSH
jgi:hypothetical protein